MEAMTQEFMLHRRPHVEIWSAREGSDDDNDSIQSQPWTIQGSTSETKRLMDPNQTKHPNNHKKGPFQKPKSDGSPTPIDTNHEIKKIHFRNKIWWIFHSNKTRRRPTSETNIWWVKTNSNVHNWSTSESEPNKRHTKHRCSSLDSITYPIKQ